MKCRFCNCDNPPYAVVCENCGEFLSNNVEDFFREGSGILDPAPDDCVRCSACWHVNPAGAETCEVCGAPLLFVPAGSFAEDAEMPEDYAGMPEDYDGYYAYEEGAEYPAEYDPMAQMTEGMIRCRSCSHDNPENAICCNYCGKKLPRRKQKAAEPDYELFRKLRNEKIYCAGCGRALPWSAITCDVCGANPRVGNVRSDFWEGDAKEHSREDYRKLWNAAHVSEPFNAEKALRRLQANGDEPITKKTVPVNQIAGRTRGSVPPDICRCDYKNKPGATTCAICGGLLQKRCPVCGYDNLPAVTVCVHCHTRFPGGKPQ